jgi:hypothetical protein
MRIYTLHEPPTDKAALDVVPVKEGFSWPAFVMSPIWALWHGLWFWAAGFTFVNIVSFCFFAIAGGNGFVQITASLSLALIIGWLANDLKRRSLIRQGFKEKAVLVANNKDIAIARFLMARPNIFLKMPKNRAGGPW